MGARKFNFIVAIDATSIVDESSSDLIKIPKKLMKLMEKGGVELGVKLILLHQPEFAPSVLFKESFLEKCHNLIEFTDNSLEFWFKLALALGSSIHTCFYTHNTKAYLTSIPENLKFIIMDSQSEEYDVTADPSIGKMQIQDLSDLDDFDFPTLKKLEIAHFEKCFPERAELESHPNFEQTLQDVIGKISKQFKKSENVELSKFVNTCNNLITQHLKSFKISLSRQDLFNDYLLSFVLEQFLADEIVNNRAIEVFAEKNIYHRKQLLD